MVKNDITFLWKAYPSRFLRGITLNYGGNYYFMNYVYSFRSESKLNYHKICANITIIVTWWCLRKIRKTTASLKTPFVVYTDTELLLEKVPTCDTNPEESFTTKIKKHTVCGYWIFLNYSFNNNKNNLIFTKMLPAWKSFVQI